MNKFDIKLTSMISIILLSAVVLLAYFYISHIISYNIIKNKIIRSQKWDLNICSGKTDGGGVNADIFKHKDIPNFVKVEDIYHLPFVDKQFRDVLCSHTIEHVDCPDDFFEELQRVGEEVTLILPPLYDITAALNFLEHKWIFLTLKKKHHSLPPYVKLPFSSTFQTIFGQRNHA